MIYMKLNNAVSEASKVLACLVLAVALVLLPAPATHAGPGMHVDHHAVSESVENADEAQTEPDNGDNSMAVVKSSAVINTVEEDNGASSCCSDICFSVDLVEGHPALFDQVTRDQKMALHAQTASIDPAGFLRPPQHLI